MKRLLVGAAFVMASLVFVPSAISAAPTIQRFPINGTFVDSVDCGFPVQVDVVGTDLEITSGNRVFDAFPQSRVTLTNLDTGKSITESLAGPGHTTFGSDGSVTLDGTGPTVVLFLFQGNPGITAFDGHFVLTIDSQGNQTLSTTGHSRDLCAELAG